MNLSFGKRILICLFVSCLTFTQAGSAVQAAVRKTDVKTAAKGNELVGVKGSFENAGKSKILKRINEIRKEACKKGYKNPDTGKKLTMQDYTAIKWSSDLEWIAQIRAAELTVNESHTRPNGSICFSLQHNKEQSWAENLAINDTGLMDGIEQWYCEKQDWIDQNPDAAGHYESLINPTHTYIGLGSFYKTSGGWYGIAAEFSFKSKMDGAKSTLEGKKTQAVEVQSKYAGAAKIQAPSTLNAGQTKKLSVVKEIAYPGIMSPKNITDGIVLGSITWSSSDKSVLTIDADGTAHAKKAGKAVISAKIAGQKKIKAAVTVE